MDTTRNAPLPDGSGVGLYVHVGFRPAQSGGTVGRKRWRWAIMLPHKTDTKARRFYLCDREGETDRETRTEVCREMLILTAREADVRPAHMNLDYGTLELVGGN